MNSANAVEMRTHCKICELNLADRLQNEEIHRMASTSKHVTMTCMKKNVLYVMFAYSVMLIFFSYFKHEIKSLKVKFLLRLFLLSQRISRRINFFLLCIGRQYLIPAMLCVTKSEN